MINMGETIRARRRALGMTQEQAASRLGVSAPAVSKWEMGASYPDVTLLPALCRRDEQESVAQISAMLSALELPWSPGECLPYERAKIKTGGHADMLAGIVREMKESEEYAFLRENEAFMALLAAHTPDEDPAS